MSFGLVLPTVALFIAPPEEPAAAAPMPVVQVSSAATPQSAAPEPQVEAVAPASPPGSAPLDPLVDPAATASQTAPATAPTAMEATAGNIEATPGDPLEGFNRAMYSVFRTADQKIIRPVAMGYKHVVPKPLRSGIRNALSNLGEPIVFVNDLLQLKPGRAIRTLVRFLTNSTIGIGGLVDVAKTPAFSLPHHDNGFGNTLAYYGVGPGPYLFLPFVGPTTLRDLLGGQGDGMVLPLAVGKPFDRWQYLVPKGALGALDQRAESDADMKALLDGAVDPYATLRSVYLQNRTAEIEALHGRTVAIGTGSLEDPLSDPASGAASPLNDPLNDPATAAPSSPDVPASDKAGTPGASAGDPPARQADPLKDPLADPAAPANP